MQVKLRKSAGMSYERWLLLLVLAVILFVVVAELRDDDGDAAADAQQQLLQQQRRTATTRTAATPVHRADGERDAPTEIPQLELFVERIRMALKPFTQKYVAKNPVAPLVGTDGTAGCGVLFSSRMEDTAIGCDAGPCPSFDTLAAARRRCADLGSFCTGITQTLSGEFEARTGRVTTKASEGLRSWRKIPDPCEHKDKIRHADANKVWEAFHDVVDASLDDLDLNLMTPLGPTREDNSIFISIAAYRDHTCKSTLRKAFERASNPDSISVGIVQQNCVSPDKCMTGTGWAESRRWVKSKGPDPDCAQDFCASDLGKRHCEAGRVRILRLDEIDALGPFFSRFLNSKLWRGENYYMQIDAHTDFRSAWDVSLVEQMRATKSYPYSVISNYPISGTPDSTHAWGPLSHPTTPDNGIPSALCGCTFEGAGRDDRQTVRLSQTGRGFSSHTEIPRRSLFVAAGFFIAHGSIVDEVGFDPFLPFLFMGEELALSVRFYTNGYDIYGPSAEVLAHEYVRKESPKFWESVGEVYSSPGFHNMLTDLVVGRVQYLVRFPEADEPSKITPHTLLTRMDTFGAGTARKVKEFVDLAQMDLVRKTQVTPSWCVQGLDPPKEARPLLPATRRHVPLNLNAKPMQRRRLGKADVDLVH